MIGSMMDHEHIEAESVIDRYVTGRLDGGEADAFEEHLIDCPPCIERVKAAESLKRGLTAVVAEEAAKIGVAAGAAALAARRWRVVRGVAAAVLISGLGVLALDRGGETERLRRELRLAQEAARQGAASSSDTAELEQRLADAEAALAAAGEERRTLAQTLERWQAPAANLPIALLSPLRGADDAFPVELPRDGRWTGLWIELGGEELAAYRAELFAPDGERVWTGEDLRFNDLGALFLQLPAELLRPGEWTLKVEGVEAPGRRPVPVATFRLAVRAP